MSELYEGFFKFYSPKNSRNGPHYLVRRYIMTTRKQTKIFAIKKYKTLDLAYTAAAAYFKELYGFTPNKLH
jgi:hypothetical protein